MILQFLRFGIVGVSNTLISYAVYSGSLICLKRLELCSGYDYIVAQIAAFILSVLWAFYWNQKKVFVVNDGEKRSFWRSLIKTYVAYAFTGLFLSTALLFFWIEVLNVSDMIAPLINLVITVPLNFIINKYWAFKTEKKKNEND